MALRGETPLKKGPAPNESFDATGASTATNAMTNPLTSFGIWVAVRVRPFNQMELGDKDVETPQTVIEMERDRKTLTLLDPSNNFRERATFGFDFCFSPFLPSIVLANTTSNGTAFDEESSDDEGAIAEKAQAEIYSAIGSPIVNSAWQGYNSCIFAYGQTSSGKSYTMMGTKRDPGIIPRLCRDLFERVEVELKAAALADNGSRKMIKISLSYMEIYNERVKDLLKSPAKSGNKQFRTRFESAAIDDEYQQLRVRQHPLHGPFVEGLRKQEVGTWLECIQFIRQGNELRSQCSTSMNESSSRSHAIFQLVVTQTEALGAKVRGKEVVNHKVSKINLVDLAGSERITRTNVTGKHVTEANYINKSLATLRKVIDALVTKKKPGQTIVVPYRESLLTWILADNFGGNSKTAMIANISPHHGNFAESESTLRYATLAKGIVNRVRVNEDPSAKLIRELQAQLRQLQTEVARGSGEGHVRDLEEQMEENKKAMEELLAREEGMRVLIQESREREEQLRVEKETLEKDQQRWRSEAERLRKEKEELKQQLQRLARGDNSAAPAPAPAPAPAATNSVNDSQHADSKKGVIRSDFWGAEEPADAAAETAAENDPNSCPPHQAQMFRRRRSSRSSLSAKDADLPFLKPEGSDPAAENTNNNEPSTTKPSSAPTQEEAQPATPTNQSTGIKPRKRSERAAAPWAADDASASTDAPAPAPASSTSDQRESMNTNTPTPEVRHGRRAATEQGERQPAPLSTEPTVRSAGPGAGRRQRNDGSTPASSPTPVGGGSGVPPSLAHLIPPSNSSVPSSPQGPTKQQAQPDALDSFLSGGAAPTQRERGKPWKASRRTGSNVNTPASV